MSGVFSHNQLQIHIRKVLLREDQTCSGRMDVFVYLIWCSSSVLSGLVSILISESLFGHAARQILAVLFLQKFLHIFIILVLTHGAPGGGGGGKSW